MNDGKVLAAEGYSRLPLLYFTIALAIMHVCNIMAFKIITIFGHQFAFTGLFFPISFLLLTILNESYGHVETERYILYILIGQTILIAIISLVARVDIGNGVKTSSLYYELYKNLYRLIISSNLAVGLSYYFTSLLNSKFKCWLLGKSSWTRFVIANGIGKAILVLFTYPINFYGILNIQQIFHICINTWLFKMSFAIVILLAAKPLVKMNKTIDKMDIYDFNIAYNPLKMYSQGNYGKNYFSKKTAQNDN